MDARVVVAAEEGLSQTLLEPPTRRSGQGRKGATKTSHESIVQQQIDSIENLDEFLAYVTNLSRWSTLRREARHCAYISHLRRVIGLMGDCQSQLQCHPVYRAFTLLSNLEQTMSALGKEDLMTQLMQLFATEVERNLTPVPDAAIMERVGKALEAVCTGKYKDPQTGDTVVFRKLGEAALFPNRPHVVGNVTLERVRPAMGGRHRQEDRRGVRQGREGRRRPAGRQRRRRPGLLAPRLQALHQRRAARLARQQRDPARVPPAAEELPRLERHGPRSGHPARAEGPDGEGARVESRFKLQSVSAVIFPHFLDQLCALLSLLESQVKEVDDLKSKILSVGVSAAITGGQLIMSLACKHFVA